MRGNARASILGLGSVFLLVASPLLAGCLTSNAEELPGGEGSAVVDYEDGTEISPSFREGNGSIIGGVRNDAGFPVARVHIAILGTDHSTETNSSGNFTFSDLGPAEYRIRADGSNYYTAAEVPVVVVPNKVARVAVTLMPRAGLSGGDLPHGHDYWADRTSVIVADQDYEFKEYERQRQGSTWGRIFGTAYGPLYSVYTGSCVSSDKQTNIGFDPPRLAFAEPAQTVWAGTSAIHVTLKWNSGDYLGETLAVAWRSPDWKYFNSSKPIRNGETFSIPVSVSQWDASHQPFTLWEIYACKQGKDDTGTGGTGSSVGRTFRGKFHATMTLIRGHEIPPEPAHPRFWANGTTVRVFDGWRNMTCGTVSGTAATGRGTCYEEFGYSVNSERTHRGEPYTSFRIVPEKLIPPGTGVVRVRLEWNAPGPTYPTKPFSITHSPASIPPWEKYTASFLKPDPKEKGQDYRLYEIKVSPADTDQFYQKKTGWMLLWNNEGEESDPEYRPSCVCPFNVHVTVEAIRDLEYGEA